MKICDVLTASFLVATVVVLFTKGKCDPSHPELPTNVSNKWWQNSDVTSNLVFVLPALVALIQPNNLREPNFVTAIALSSLLLFAGSSIWHIQVHASKQQHRCQSYLLIDRLTMALVYGAVLAASSYMALALTCPDHEHNYSTAALIGVAYSVLLMMSAVLCRYSTVEKAYVFVRSSIAVALFIFFYQFFQSDKVSAKGVLAVGLALSIACDIAQIPEVDLWMYNATKQTFSGHSLKHVLAGTALACYISFYMTQNL